MGDRLHARAAGRVLVLGAGFQGACIALALRQQGYVVSLIDKAPDCLLRASLRNEGKIHLGLVYANDASFQTSDLMLRSALSFGPLIERWLEGCVDWQSLRSRLFTYVIARDSLLDPSKIFERYQQVQDKYRVLVEESGKRASYLGQTPQQLWREVSHARHNELMRKVSPDFASRFVETAEVALDLARFRSLMRAALHSDGIERFYRHTVQSVARTSTGFRVEGETEDGQVWRQEADMVVNCLWEGRLALDRKMGLAPKRPWIYRLKYRLLGELPASLSTLPSLTLVLGRFGDLVVSPPGPTYFSWYPACMKGWSSDITIPPTWQPPCDGQVQKQEAQAIADDVLRQYERVIPGVRDSRIDTVDAGVIFSWGKSDIDDPDSELHQRHDIGVAEHDGYFSVDTGKFTCAPFFADQLLQRLS